MKKLILSLACIGICACSGSHHTTTPDETVLPPALTSRLRTYDDEEALKDYLRDSKAQARSITTEGAEDMPSPVSTPAGDAARTTNNQEAAADEGGLVKSYGSFLVILRRGKLYTVRVPLLRKSGETTVKADGLDDNAWYDELLMKDDIAIVIGYRWGMGGIGGTADPSNYWQGATEINLFKVDAASGGLSRQGTYFIESGDYYSGRNYASRLVGEKLVVYSPYYGNRLLDERNQLRFPRLKELRNGRIETLSALMGASDVSVPEDMILFPVLHSVHVCTLGTGRNAHEALSCKSRGVLGSWRAEHYVTGSRFYLWSGRQQILYGWCGAQVAPAEERVPPQASSNLLYAFDLEGSGGGVTKVWGDPLDQFSFDETPNGLTFFHYQRSPNPVFPDSSEDGRCGYRDDHYAYRLGQIPFSRFTAQASDIREADYRGLADDILRTAPYVLSHRFTEEELVLGQYDKIAIFSRADPSHKTVLGLDPRRGSGPSTSEARCYRTIRIEPAGERLMVSAQSGNELSVQAVTLGESPEITSSASLMGYTGAESRSHGYLFATRGYGEGLIGLATQAVVPPEVLSAPLGAEAMRVPLPTSVHILRLGSRGDLQVIGRLEPSEVPSAEACETSCVDWYGNTRAIFLGDQVYGLMGDELGSALLDPNGSIEGEHRMSLTSEREP